MSALEVALLLDTVGGLVLSLVIWVIYHRLMAMETAAMQGVPVVARTDSPVAFDRDRAA